MIAHRNLARFFFKPFPQIRWSFPPETNAIYLTFDDGPHPPVTQPLLDYLADAQIPATFFLSGEQIFRNRNQLVNLDYGEHVLGSHSFHHTAMAELRNAQIERELAFANQLICDKFGKMPTLFRPPYGIFDERIFPALRKMNQQMVLWSVMAYDFKWQSDKIMKHLRHSLRPGDIVVFHDSAQTAPHLLTCVRQMVDFCREKQWQFLPVPALDSEIEKGCNNGIR